MSWLRKLWWSLRHKVYLNQNIVAPSGGDDTKNIQQVIDHVAFATPWAFDKAQFRYYRSRFKWLRREPVLKNVVQLTAGEFTIKKPLELGRNLEFRGVTKDKTIIKGIE